LINPRSPFFVKRGFELLFKCKDFKDVEKIYGEENLIKIVNLKQIVFYAKMKCQPVWIDEGLDGKLVAFYYAPETKMAWEYWRAKKPDSNGR
jgi:hypothetical protein